MRDGQLDVRSQTWTGLPRSVVVFHPGGPPADVQFPELAVAAYNKNPAAPNDPDGIVAVWNLHLLERPEFVFHSPVCILHSETFSADASLTCSP